MCCWSVDYHSSQFKIRLGLQLRDTGHINMATNVQEHTASIQAAFRAIWRQDCAVTRIFWLPLPDDHLQKHLAHSSFYQFAYSPPLRKTPPSPLLNVDQSQIDCAGAKSGQH